jgi:hypothetical protein
MKFDDTEHFAAMEELKNIKVPKEFFYSVVGLMIGEMLFRQSGKFSKRKKKKGKKEKSRGD